MNTANKAMKPIYILILLCIFHDSVSGTTVTGNLSGVVKSPASNVAILIKGHPDVTAAKATIKFCDKLSIPCMSVNYNFPTIDGYTPNQLYSGLLEKNYTVLLIVSYIDEAHEKRKVLDTRQTVHQGTVRQTGSNTYQYSGTSQQTGDEYFMNLREIAYKVDVFHLPNSKHLYTGQMRTKRSGIFSGDKSMLTSGMKKLAKEFKAMGLLK